MAHNKSHVFAFWTSPLPLI